MTSSIPSSLDENYPLIHESKVYASDAEAPEVIRKATEEAKKLAHKAWIDYKKGLMELPDLKSNPHQIDPQPIILPKESLSCEESVQINQAVADAKSQANEAFDQYRQTKK